MTYDLLESYRKKMEDNFYVFKNKAAENTNKWHISRRGGTKSLCGRVSLVSQPNRNTVLKEVIEGDKGFEQVLDLGSEGGELCKRCGFMWMQKPVNSLKVDDFKCFFGEETPEQKKRNTVDRK